MRHSAGKGGTLTRVARADPVRYPSLSLKTATA